MKKLLFFFLFLLSLESFGQFRINSVSPTRNAINVAANATISVQLNTNIDAATLNYQNLRIYGSQTGFYTAGTLTGGGTNTISYTPSSYNFKKGETITLSFTTALKNESTIAFASTTQWQFVVKADASGIAFASAVKYSSGGTLPTTPCVGDWDNDGDIDVATNNYNSNNIGFLKNNGNGILSTVATVNTGKVTPNWVAPIDVEADGDLDVVSADASTAYSITILKNNASGTFSSPSSTFTNQPSRAFPFDMDGDGDLDLATHYYGGNQINTLKNNGSGSFSSHTSQLSSGTQPYDVVGADFDNDGDIDLVTVIQNLHKLIHL